MGHRHAHKSCAIPSEVGGNQASAAFFLILIPLLLLKEQCLHEVKVSAQISSHCDGFYEGDFSKLLLQLYVISIQPKSSIGQTCIPKKAPDILDQQIRVLHCGEMRANVMHHP